MSDTESYEDKREQEEREAKILAADYPFELTLKFNDKHVMEVFIIHMCDGDGDQQAAHAAERELDVALDWSYGEKVIRVYSEPLDS